MLKQPVRALAQAFVPHSNALFLGRGEMYPIALEGLKLKEISYIHAKGTPPGAKHGPLALVDEHMPVVATPNDELLEKLESNLQEVRPGAGSFTSSPTRTRLEPDLGGYNPQSRLPGPPRAHHPYPSAAAPGLLCGRASGHGCGPASKFAKSVTVE